jgi:lantibiotic biosynthesis protein
MVSVFEETAYSIAARLCRDAIWHENRCNWIGPSMEPRQGRWTVVTRSLGVDLYGGTSGIAWFLAKAYQATGERLFQKTARGALARTWNQTQQNEKTLSFYSGTVGIACALIEAGIAIDQERFVEHGLSLTEALPEVPLAAQGLDVVGGLAGAIPALLRIAGQHRRPVLQVLALRCGEYLAAQARRAESGWWWNTTGDDAAPGLTGFSHGSAGMGWAFLELFATTGDAKYKQWANEAFSYERHHFDAAQGNWPDFRAMAQAQPSPAARQQTACSLAWCHGAPGIGLSRLRAYQLTGDEACRKEAEAAVNTVSASLKMPYAMRSGFSLCHGNAGNAALLLEAARLFKQLDLRLLVENLAADAATQFEMAGQHWACGVTDAGESPNLLLGIAGIGYFYLRLLNENIENILCYGQQMPANLEQDTALETPEYLFG